jgi:hypothetical protein
MSPTQSPKNLRAISLSLRRYARDERISVSFRIAVTTHLSAAGHSLDFSPLKSRGKLTKCSDGRLRGWSGKVQESAKVSNSWSVRISLRIAARVSASRAAETQSHIRFYVRYLPLPMQIQATHGLFS